MFSHLPSFNLMMRCKHRWCLVLTAYVITGLDISPTHSASVSILERGDLTPTDNRAFISFGLPALNNSGQLAVTARLANLQNSSNDNVGVYRADGSSVTEITREGADVPDGGGQFDHFSTALFSPEIFLSTPSINHTGEVTFFSRIRNLGMGVGETAIYRYDGTSLNLVVREDQALPGGSGHYGKIGMGRFGPTLGQGGEVAFFAGTRATVGAVDTGAGIYVSNGIETTPVVHSGDLAPDANGTFTENFTPSLALIGGNGPVLGNHGEVSFHAELTGTLMGDIDDEGIFLHDGSGLTQIIREGQILGSATELILTQSQPRINSHGHVAYTAKIQPDPTAIDSSGVFVFDGSDRHEIARANTPLPTGATGVFVEFNSIAVINDTGLIVTRTSVAISGGPTENSLYMFGGTGPVQIAREGESVPEGNGQFELFGDPALNSGGQVVFISGLQETAGGGSDDLGLYIADRNELLKVTRTGDLVNGKIVETVSFATGSGGSDGLSSGLNDLGQVAYQVGFADKTEGLYLFTPELNW